MLRFDKTTCALSLLALGAGIAALVSAAPLACVLWAWTALSFGFVALAFAFNQPAWLGKRADGSVRFWWLVFSAPYQFFNALSLQILWWNDRRELICEVAPNLWIGARLPPRVANSRKEKFVAVLDLAAELPEARALRGRIYRSHPTLDTRAPANLRELAVWINAARRDGAVFVHCAAGRGRSATAACAALIQSGEVSGTEEARRLVRERRAVETNLAQIAALVELEQQIRAASASKP